VRAFTAKISVILSSATVACGISHNTLNVGPTIASVIVVGETSEGTKAWAFGTSAPVELISAGLLGDSQDYVLTVLGYRAELDALLLPEGPVELVAEGDPLPRWDAQWTAQDEAPQFQTSTATRAAIVELRIKRSTDLCLERGSCFGRADQICQPSCAYTPPPPDVAAPNAPVFGPCPAGWTEVVDPTLGPRCEPWAQDRPPYCGPQQAIFPGERRCHLLGDPCPADQFAPGLPASTLFVNGTAAAGGNGTRLAPYQRIAAALAASRPGMTIALAPGSYAEAVVLPDGISLRGACAAETTIAGPPTGVVVDLVGSASVAGLSIVGGQTALRAGSGRQSLRGLWITGATVEGLLLGPGAQTTVRDLAVRDLAGSGLVVHASTLNGARISVRETVGAAIRTVDSEALLTDVTISDLSRPSAQPRASGIEVLGGGIQLERVTIERSVSNAIRADQTQLRASDLWVRDIGAGTMDRGSGLLIHQSIAELDRLLVLGATDAGLVIDGASTARVNDVLVADLRTPADASPDGIYADSSQVEIQRVRIDTYGDGIQLNATEGTLSATVSDADLTPGIQTPSLQHRRSAVLCSGVQARCRLERIQSERYANGLRAIDGASVEARDVRLRLSGMVTSIDLGGRGVVVQASRMRLNRAIIERMSASSVYLENRASLEAADVYWGDPAPCGSDCAEARTAVGALLVSESRLTLRRFKIEGTSVAGIDTGQSGTVDLAEGTFENNAIGVRFPKGFDRAQLLHEIRYQGNAENWQQLP